MSPIQKELTNSTVTIKSTTADLPNNIETKVEIIKADEISFAILNSHFIEDVKQIKKYLLQIQKRCGDFDEKNPALDQQIKFINSLKANFYDILDNHFFRAWQIVEDMNTAELKAHQNYYQKELLSFFMVTPYTKRVHEKPLGYPGDYLLMIYLYEDGFEGEGSYGKLIHRYSMRVPTAIANRNRISYFKQHINKVTSKMIAPRITSIACGPAKEIIEALKTDAASKKGAFICLDFEPKAIAYLKQEVQKLENDLNEKINVTLLQDNITTLLKSRKIDHLLGRQNLIYSTGLIDYFNDKIAAKIIEVLFGQLESLGVLIVGNVSKKDKHRAYTELLGEWYLNLRDETDMLNLAKNLSGSKECHVEYEEETKMNLFLVITKL